MSVLDPSEKGNNQDEKFLDDHIPGVEPSRPTRIGSSQNDTSCVDQIRQILCFKSKLSPTAPEFASSAPQDFAPDSSKAKLSGEGSNSMSSGRIYNVPIDSTSSNDASSQTSYSSPDGQRLVVEPSVRKRDFRNENQMQYQQTRECHDGPIDTSQPGSLPFIAPPCLSKSSSLNTAIPYTGNTGTDRLVLPSSPGEDGFLRIASLEPTKSETTRTANDVLTALDIPDNLSVPNASYQREDYHKQPDAQSLTHILQIAAQRRKILDDEISVLKKSEEDLRDQIKSLTAETEDLGKPQEQTAPSSAESDDLKEQLSAAQDQIRQFKESAESDLGHALDQIEELKDEKERIQRVRDWYLNRAKTLQFVENADLKDRIRQLEEQIKDLEFYPERLKRDHRERINGLESSLKTVLEHRGELQKRLVQVSNQRSKTLQQLARGFKGHGLLSACVHDCHAIENSLREQVKNLQEKVTFLEQQELDMSRTIFENKELRQENRTLQSDRMKFSNRISRLQRDRTGARKAFRELEKRDQDASLKTFEKEKIAWVGKEADYVKQIADKEIKLAENDEEHQRQLKVLQKQLSEKAWEAEKAQSELQKYKSQQVDDALRQESSRGRNISRNDKTSKTPPASDSVRSSSEESGCSRTPASSPKTTSGKICLKPTGREDYM